MGKLNQEKKAARAGINVKIISLVSAIAIVATPLLSYNVNAASSRTTSKNKYVKSSTTTATTTKTSTTTTAAKTTTTPTIAPVATIKAPATTATITPAATMAPAAATATGTVDMSTAYGLKAGQTLYYNSAANKHYYDSNFTQSPQKVSDILNKAFLDNKDKGVDILVPAGDYLLDKPLVLQNGARLVGVPGKTRFIIDDTFDRNYDDFIISNAPNSQVYIDGIYVEYIGFKTPPFSDPAQNPSGIEGMILKISNTTKATVTNSSFVVKNNGIKTKCTPVWFRDGYSNVDIHNCYIENTSAGVAGGCLWFMCNDGKIGDSVNVYNNTIVKNGKDEEIAIWGNGGTHTNYNIYNNTINYIADANNTSVDNLITVFSYGTGTYKNIKFSNNNINLTGMAMRILLCDVEKSTFSNVVFENNNIKEYVGDPTGVKLISAFEVWCSKLAVETDNETMYKRCDVSFNNNSYVNSSKDGRRCLASASSALMKLNGNTVNSNFVYNMFFEEDGNSKIISTGNDYNYAGTGNCGFAKISGTNTKAYFTNDKIKLDGTSTSQSNLSFVNCTLK